MATATPINITSSAFIINYEGINATNFGATSSFVTSVKYEDYNVITLIDYSLAQYTKFQGYFATTQEYENWVLRNQSSSASPTGKSLQNISIVHSWIDK